jgi:nicotinamidase/pyrazinamidase
MCRTISARRGARGADGDAVVPVINRLAERFDHVVLTQDGILQATAPSPRRIREKTPSTASPCLMASKRFGPIIAAGHAGAAFHPKLVIDRAELIIRKGFSVRNRFLFGVF